MLQSIREKSQGVFAWIIVIIIVIPFALWGIQEYLQVGGKSYVASVNGNDLPFNEFQREYQQRQARLREMLGVNYSQFISEAQIKKQVIDGLIQDAVMRDASKQLMFRVGEEQVIEAVSNITAFQKQGKFDTEVYKLQLRSQGMTPKLFEVRIRQALVNDQLRQGIQKTAFITDYEANHLAQLEAQEREIETVTVKTSSFAKSVEITDDEIANHYNSNKDRFQDPEQVKIEFVDLDVASIADKIEPTEVALQKLYESRKSALTAPERRHASHILMQLEEGATDDVVAKKRAQAMTAVKRINDGADFAEVAKTMSEDVGSAAEGGDLDFFEKGEMVPAFEKTVFAMNIGDISEPVRSKFGFHIIKLHEIQKEGTMLFSEARERLADELRQEEAEKVFFEQSEPLANLAYEHPDSLDVVTKELGLEVKESEWFSRSSSTGLAKSPKIIAAAFSEDVLIKGNNSAVVEVAADRMVVLRVKEHKPAASKPLDKVADEIKVTLQQKKMKKLAKEKGQELFQRLQTGELMSALVTADEGLVMQDKTKVKHDDKTLSAPLLKAIFKMDRPKDDAPTSGYTILNSGDFVLISLLAVHDVPVTDAYKTNPKKREELVRAMGEAEFNGVLAGLRSKADVKEYPNKL